MTEQQTEILSPILKSLSVQKIKTETEETKYNSNLLASLVIEGQRPSFSAYQHLNTLISEVNTQLWDDKQKELYYSEMLLFSIADNIVFNDIVNRLNITISK